MSRFLLNGSVGLTHFDATEYAAIGTPTAITMAEVATGENILTQTNDPLGECAFAMEGWTTTPNTEETPSLCSRTVSKIPGLINLDDSSIQYYDAAATPVKTYLAKDLAGYVLVAPRGNAVGNRYRLWPATVISNDDDLNTSGAHTYTVSFAVGEPTDGVFA